MRNIVVGAESIIALRGHATLIAIWGRDRMVTFKPLPPIYIPKMDNNLPNLWLLCLELQDLAELSSET